MSIETQELSLTEALDILLYKARNNRLVRRRYSLLLRENERKMQPPVKEFMDYMIRKLKAGLSDMEGKTPTQKAKSIAYWREIEEKGQEIFKPAFFDILNSGANSVQRELKKQERFDPIGVEAVNWTNTHSAELVMEITQETMEGIRDVIATGINAGKSMPTIARELRPIVGLNTQYAGAVSNFHSRLIAEGVAASKATAKAEAYAGRLHRRRTMTIVRTETAFALSEGQRQGYGQMGIENLERVEDPACCDICAEYNGKVYNVKEAEGVLPEHPNCEGTWVAATGEELKPYVIEATGPRQAKVASLEDALKELPRRHVMRVEKYHIDVPGKMVVDVPHFKGEAAGYWNYGDKSIHLSSKWAANKQVVFHEVGHAAYETGIVPFNQKPLWSAWHKKATNLQIKYPNSYALSNVDEFFAECYSQYHLKNYHLIDSGIKKWFDKTFKGGM